MSMKTSFLLIGTKSERPWATCLKSALADLGKLIVVPENKALQTVSKYYYSLIFIDSNEVGDVSKLVFSLHSKSPKARIIVFTASPVWQRARAALKAGAAEYLRKKLDKDKLRSEILAVLNHPPPTVRISKPNRSYFDDKTCYSIC